MANAVATGAIADKSVTFAKLADNSVYSQNIADSQINRIKITNLAINDEKIASNAVTTAKIADAAVTPTKLSQPYARRITSNQHFWGSGSTIGANGFVYSPTISGVGISVDDIVVASLSGLSLTDLRKLIPWAYTVGTGQVGLTVYNLTNASINIGGMLARIIVLRPQ